MFHSETNGTAVSAWLPPPFHMFILRGTSSIVHMTLHQPPLLLEILEEVTKSLESCASSLEIEYIFYKRNIHAVYLTRDVPKDSSVDTVDSSIVGQALLGQIHSGF